MEEALTTATTTTEAEAREAKRRELAQKAANLDQVQRDLKAFVVKFREREVAEERRRRSWEEETGKVRNELSKLRAAAKRVANAKEELRLNYVPRELSLAVSAAEREVRKAAKDLETADMDLRGERAALAGVKERLAKVGSGANPHDLRAEIKRMEDAMAANELVALKAKEALDVAQARAAAAKRAFDAAMGAALAL